MHERKISSSIVTNLYINLYEKLGFEFLDRESYKNFVVIYTSKIKEDEKDDETEENNEIKKEENKDNELAEEDNRLAMI